MKNDSSFRLRKKSKSFFYLLSNKRRFRKSEINHFYSFFFIIYSLIKNRTSLRFFIDFSRRKVYNKIYITMGYYVLREEYLRTAMLVGEEGIKTFNNSSVIVFGVGGVGSFAVEAISRLGLKRLDVVDSDTVSVSNINRQLIALHSTVGKKKVDVIKERILDISPETSVTAFDLYFDAETAEKIDFSLYSYIIDAIDSIESKVLLIKKAKEYGVPIISALSTGNKLDASSFKIADIFETSTCPIARILRKRLREENISSLKVLYSTDTPLSPDSSFLAKDGKKAVGSVSFVPSAAGLLIAGEVARDLLSLGSKNELH